jgi:hypothetical protein
MSVAVFIYAFLLFFVLTPGILLTLPPKGSKMVVAAVHAVVFAIVWVLTSKLLWHATSKVSEGVGLLRGPDSDDSKTYYGGPYYTAGSWFDVNSLDFYRNPSKYVSLDLLSQ